MADFTILRNPTKNDFVHICWTLAQMMPACKKPVPFDEAVRRYSNLKFLTRVYAIDHTRPCVAVARNITVVTERCLEHMTQWQ